MKVKICCIQNLEEAELALRYGASEIGLVSKMPSGPGVIDDAHIKSITLAFKGKLSVCLLSAEIQTESIVKQAMDFGIDSIQMVDYPQEKVYNDLKKALPHITFIQVIHVQDESSIDLAERYATYADCILLDTGRPDLETKVLGGTGKTHNWDISRRIVERIDKPVFLAGGLHSNNVGKAIKQVGPYGVDVCSGVRSEGILDERKLSEFFKAIETAL